MTNTEGSHGNLGPDDYFRLNMKSERERKGWSQAQFAKELEASGGPTLHQQTVQKIESGTRSVKLTEASAIAKCLGVNVDDMLADVTDNALMDAEDELEERRNAVYSAVRRYWEAGLAHAIILDAYKAAGLDPIHIHIGEVLPENLEEVAVRQWEYWGSLHEVTKQLHRLRARADPEIAPFIPGAAPLQEPAGEYVGYFFKTHPRLTGSNGMVPVDGESGE
ncbi:helix-turn-helix transcriptional regulator [Nesterenkonia xinjiangensis]|uniref:Transcriptional regulator with XRE-family HTH domain n=1 Tax=Nesterenkonia xinjiangensis TaxID=225327 RepID=A0A7Z0K9Y4_9MICC|nr:helix-turn-helix transcriptional regulator [Nesterenkonia xinjiangensis]NYJ78258.1 transcriptional regulator with XRE-family HTH domain [Nesterenkonia xinjiangensis]